MTSSPLRSIKTCEACGSPLSASLRHCPTCQFDAGAPNVRRSQSKENQEALLARYEDSRKQCMAEGRLQEFQEFEKLIKEKSGVVVAMRPSVARSLFEDPSVIYLNYDQLVGNKIRKPADFDHDRDRCEVGFSLFGSYKDLIIYGALSLTQEGLATYGKVSCRLKAITIEKRTSFLEMNSFKFVSAHKVTLGKELPNGYTACWENRHLLALAKLSHLLTVGQGEDEWQEALIHSDGEKRENDEFIEAHIFENFDHNAIESIVQSPNCKLSRNEKLDLNIAVSEFKKLPRNVK